MCPLFAQQMPEQSSKDKQQGCYRHKTCSDTLTWCYRRTHWGWLMTLVCSGWLVLPAMIYGGLVRGMQARPASTGTVSSSSSTRTSLQPMTFCQMTSRWAHARSNLPHNAAAAVTILSSPGARTDCQTWLVMLCPPCHEAFSPTQIA